MADADAPKMVNLAEMAAKPTRPEGGFGFGLKNAPAMLRYLADEIDAQRILLEDVTETAKAKRDDFVHHTLVFFFGVRRPAP